MIGPDDLEPGQTYRFDYISWCGVPVCILGKFVRNYIEFKILWFEFDQGNGLVVPFDYSALNNLRKVE